MTSPLLFEHFATLATAPEGISRLRELILQLAVQGKLGTQNPGDEPAEMLVQRIRKEKEKLVKEGKISKQQFKDHISAAESLPNSWLVGHLDDFFYRIPVTKNKIPTTSFQKAGPIPVIDQSQKFIAGYTNDSPKILKIPGPVIIFGDHTREIKYIDFNFVVGADGVIVLKPLNEFEKYFYLVMQSLQFEDKGYSRHFKILSNYLFPLPPLAEQHRIVAKVDRLMALCDELEARQQQERAGCLRLGTASLTALQNAESPEKFGRKWAQVCVAFDLILDCPENVAVLRQTILQLAVQGKLGTQSSKDEPANQILLKIESENNQKKTRVTRKSHPVNRDELSKLPKGWVWTTLDKIAELKGGITKDSHRVVDDGRVVPYLRVANVQNGFLDLRVMKSIEASNSVIAELSLKKDDILFTEGGDRDKLGRGWIWQDELPECIYQNHIFRARLYLKEISPKYISWYGYTQSQNYFMKKGKQTTNLASINMTQLSAFPVALPPLAEQQRIVAKVDALMALCDALESRLKERAGVQGRLAGAVGKTVTNAN